MNKNARMIAPSPLGLMAGAMSALLAGCGGNGDRLETFPVSGRVIINGEPAAGCTVAFVPLDPDLNGQIMPGGKANESGEFQLTTYETGDGAPAGEYGVTLRWEATRWPGRKKQMQLDPVQPIGPDMLLGQFSSPKKSELTVTIVDGENQLEPFRLEGARLMEGAR